MRKKAVWKKMVAKEIQNICFELFYFWHHMFLMAINFNWFNTTKKSFYFFFLLVYSHLILIYTLSVCVHLCLVAKSCPTLWDATNCSLPVSSVHVILQARILEWVVISFSRGSSQPRDQNCTFCQVSCIAGGFFYHWATEEAQTIYSN